MRRVILLFTLILTGIVAVDAIKSSTFRRKKKHQTLYKDCGDVKINKHHEIAGKPYQPWIIDGNSATRGKWPWQALIDGDIEGEPFDCGGSLIHPKYVLTAAHCADEIRYHPENITVRLGKHYFDEEKGEIEMLVEKIIVHEDYSEFTSQHDIALLQLKEEVSLNDYIQPVCLPSVNPRVGTRCYVTGWGDTTSDGRPPKVLQQGRLPIVSKKKCKRVNTYSPIALVTDDMLCAGEFGKHGSRTAFCSGDSGGPLVCKNKKGHWEVVGVVSWNFNGCDSSLGYDVFADVSYHKKWILQNTKQ